MLKITLKAARVNAGFNQKEAAKLLNVTNQTLVNWENGKSQPTAGKIDELCRLYDIAYDNLKFF